MTDSTLYGNTIPSGTSAFTGASSCDVSLQVHADSDCQLKGYRWWVPSGGDTAGANRTYRLYQMTSGTTGTLISAGTVTGSGTWTAEQWNDTLLGTPVSLSPGTSYLLLASCVNDSRRYIHSWWASGAGSSGITSGPVTAPSKAAALGGQQQLFVSPSTGSFPGGTSDGEFFGLDLIVADAASQSAAASLTVSPSFSAARAHSQFRAASLVVAVALAASPAAVHVPSAALTVTPSFSAAAARTAPRTASLTVVPSLAAAPAAAHLPSVSLAVSPSLSAAGSRPVAAANASLTVRPVLLVTASHTGNPALLPGYPDVAHAVCDLLASLVAGADIETPEDLQSRLPWIRVTRTGGSSDLVTDNAPVVVDVLAAGATEARAIAEQARQRLIRGPFRSDVSFRTAHGQVDKVRCTVGPQLIPPADSDNLRLVTASYNVSVRR